MSRGWLLLSRVRVDAPLMMAIDDDEWLAAWPVNAGSTGSKPHPDARQCDPAMLDADGPAMEISLLWLAKEHMPTFDDPAVVQCRRNALSGNWGRGGCALTLDSVHFAGSVWLDTPGSDPFSLVARGRQVSVGAGFFSPTMRPAGPAIERYAGAPWPAGTFAAPSPAPAE